MNIFRYVVQYDGGSAPRPYGDVCSLAICKPNIRKTASIGDWIIGVRSRRHNQVVYVMQIDEILPFEQYWCDPRFKDRRPSASPVPDNIYRPNGRGDLEQVDNNGIHGASNVSTDLSGRNVLLGRRFWYFGSSSPELPDNLRHLKPYQMGHSVHINRRKGDIDIKDLENWLKLSPCGISGEPINASEQLRSWYSTCQGPCTDSPTKNASATGCSTRSASNSSQMRRPSIKCCQ